MVGATFKPTSYDTVSGYDYHDSKEELAGGSFTSLGAVIQMVEVDEHGEEMTSHDAHLPEPINWG